MATRNSSLTQERLKELLHYDSDTGIFTWRVTRCNRLAGTVAGAYKARGWGTIKIDGRTYLPHMLAWLYVYGFIPTRKTVEWLDGNLANNRIANMRLRTPSAAIEVTADRVRELLDYNPETGLFVYKVSPVGSVRIGDAFGAPDSLGYLRGRVGTKTHGCHRIAWLYVHGVWPIGEIDHINGNPSDNRIANLRDVSKSENLQNQRRAHANSTSGLLGVSLANSGRWKASIQTNGKNKTLGHFNTAEEAHAAYLAAKRELHSTCTI